MVLTNKRWLGAITPIGGPYREIHSLACTRAYWTNFPPDALLQELLSFSDGLCLVYMEFKR
jgi:hypothetical protein